jgi:hypothetical protein
MVTPKRKTRTIKKMIFKWPFPFQRDIGSSLLRSLRSLRDFKRALSSSQELSQSFLSIPLFHLLERGDFTGRGNPIHRILRLPSMANLEIEAGTF